MSQPDDGASADAAASGMRLPNDPEMTLTAKVLAGPRPNDQLVSARDQRFQLWFFYLLLTTFSIAYFGLFFCIVARASFHALDWSFSTSPKDAAEQLGALGVALSKFPPTTSAIMGAVIASFVAIPLSLCVAIGKLVKQEKEAPPTDSSSFTSAFFELGKAMATGWNAVKGK
ncbi:hypothetical protein QMZ25_17240 [Stenotrophomonas sp. RS-48]|uniref:hypothetical protein n=1 Tax=Stenotrophomonas sp. RS-48 TaxID=3043300 RepID=UPI0024B5A8A2|nr:hypothetical protein [Stenotrophomonas sp. RS-48]MDI9250345.1 hypothetical protein [Stenotrophomonas sp. RS-48]